MTSLPRCSSAGQGPGGRPVLRVWLPPASACATAAGWDKTLVQDNTGSGGNSRVGSRLSFHTACPLIPAKYETGQNSLPVPGKCSRVLNQKHRKKHPHCTSLEEDTVPSLGSAGSRGRTPVCPTPGAREWSTVSGPADLLGPRPALQACRVLAPCGWAFPPPSCRPVCGRRAQVCLSLPRGDATFPHPVKPSWAVGVPACGEGGRRKGSFGQPLAHLQAQALRRHFLTREGTARGAPPPPGPGRAV